MCYLIFGTRKDFQLRNDIHCLMVSGVSLSSLMADVLFDTACIMLKEGSSRKIIKDPDIEGEIRTHFDEQALGGIAGVEFRATVETSMGTGNVKYLVRPIDANRRNEYEWAPFFSVEEMLDELNAPPSRRVSAYN